MIRAVLGETPFAVVDVEATGIDPGRHDRISEIVVVRLSPTLKIEEEWHTLVNPRRDIGRTDIHGRGWVRDHAWGLNRDRAVGSDAAVEMAMNVLHGMREAGHDPDFDTNQCRKCAARGITRRASQVEHELVRGVA